MIMIPIFIFIGGLSLISILNGHEARTEIKQNPAAQKGNGLALTGLMIGYGNIATICLVLFCLFLLD